MDGIGIGPSGPPVPPEAVFSVIPYPAEREAIRLLDCGQRYAFISSVDSDPNIKEDVSEVDKLMADKKVRLFIYYLLFIFTSRAGNLEVMFELRYF